MGIICPKGTIVICPKCKGELYRVCRDVSGVLSIDDLEVIYGFELFQGCEYKSHCCNLRFLVMGRLSTKEGWKDFQLTKEALE